MLEKPEVGLKIIQIFSERLRRYETRLEDATLKDVHARLADIIVILVESEGVRSGTGYRIPHPLQPPRLARPRYRRERRTMSARSVRYATSAPGRSR